MKYQRLIPLITPLLVWSLSQAFLWRSDFFYSALALATLLIVLSVKYLISATRGYWLPFIIPPVLFFLSFSFYATIIISRFWIQLIFLLIAWFLFSYLRNLYYYLGRADSSQPWGLKLDNLLVASSFLTIFAASAVLFDLPAFLNWPWYYLLPAVVIITGLSYFQFRLLPSDGQRVSYGFLLVNIVIITEFSWALSLLPLNFHILALFLAIFYYVSLIIIRLEERGSLNRQALKLTLILSSLAILLLLLTARWL